MVPQDFVTAACPGQIALRRHGAYRAKDRIIESAGGIWSRRRRIAESRARQFSPMSPKEACVRASVRLHRRAATPCIHPATVPTCHGRGRRGRYRRAFAPFLHLAPIGYDLQNGKRLGAVFATDAQGSVADSKAGRHDRDRGYVASPRAHMIE